MKPPKRKRAKLPSGYLPFPVRVERPAESGERQTQFICKGVLQADGTVEIWSPGDMDFLYQMGFYGKGSLSRHEPVFDQLVEQENVQGIEQHLQSISMDRYRCSLHASVNATATHTEQVSPQRFANINNMDADDWKFLKPQAGVEAVYKPTNDSESSTTAAECKAVAAEQIADSEVVQQEVHPVQVSDDCDMEHTDVAKMIDGGCDQRRVSVGAASKAQTEPRGANVSGHGFSQPSKYDLLTCEEDEAWMSPRCQQPDDVWPADVHGVWDSDRPPPTVFDSPPAATNDVSAQLSTSATDDIPSIQMMECEDLAHAEGSNERGLLLDEEERSLSDSSDDYLPLSDLDIASDSGRKEKKQYYTKRECLVLQAYEIVFLKLAFNCVQVIDGLTDKSVALNELWRRCMERDKSFLPLYAVYHHIRAKGWVPKDGLTYGCDFMVYKKGPKYYHSSVGVAVKCCDANSLQELPELNPRVLSWSKLMGLSRVLTNVKKELLLCHVLIPPDITDGKLSSPEQTLRALSISETLLTRIVPSRERDSSLRDRKTAAANAASSRDVTTTAGV